MKLKSKIALILLSALILLLTFNYLFTKHVLAIAATSIFLLTWLLLKHLFLNRLHQLKEEIADIDTKEKCVKQITVTGNDEINEITESVNNLLRIVETSTTRFSCYDSLTGLPNRTLFNKLLKKAIEDSELNNDNIAVLLLDIDRFKLINNMFNHTTGDHFLNALAVKLNNIINQNGVIARMGGDIFAFFFKNIKETDDINIFLQEILKIIRTPHTVDDITFRFSGSIGISYYPNDGNSVEKLLRNADIAMFKAKKTGGDSYCYYTKTMNEEIKKELLVENEIRYALKNNSLPIYYQPIVNIKTNKIIGVEALARWKHSSGNIISPDNFIPITEKTDLINYLGNFVLEKACKTKKEWEIENGNNLLLTVNFSYKQFFAPNFISTITNIIENSQIDPKTLIIEITENILTESEGIAIKKLSLLHEMGIKIAVDDFGTGYSSLSFLKRFPIDYLKIDKSFIEDIPNNKDAKAIIKTIISLGKTLNLQIIAEGIENESQLNCIRKLGCGLAQGFLFYRPLPQNKIAEILFAGSSIYQK